MSAEAVSALGRWARALVEGGWLVALAAVPVAVNPYSRQAFEPDKTALFLGLVGLMVLAWMVAAVADGTARRAVASPAVSPAAALALPAALSLAASAALSIDPYRSWMGSYVRRQGAVTELAFLVFFVLVASHLRRRKQWVRAGAVLVTGSVPVCVFAVFQRAGIDPIPWHATHRVGSLTGNPVFLAAYLVLIVPVTCAFLAAGLAGGRSRTGWLRPGLLAYALALQLAALLLTGSRGPAVALVAGILFLALAASRALEPECSPPRLRRLRRLRAALLAVVLLASVVLAVAARSPSAARLPIVGRFTTALDPAAETTRVRLEVWRGAAHRALYPLPPDGWQRRLAGHGPETFSLAFLGVAPVSLSRLGEMGKLPDRAHNVLWEVVITRGVLGVAATFILFGGVLVLGLRELGLLPDRRRRWLLAGLTVGGAGAAAATALAAGEAALLGPAVGCGLAVGPIAFVALAARAPSRPTAGAGWRRLVAAASTSACLIHWFEIQVGFGITASRVCFYALAAGVVALGRADDSERESSGPGAADARARGLALAAVLVCLAFALAGTLPQPLAQRSGLDGATAAAATTLLVAVAAALCVGGALLARADPPGSRSVLLPFAAAATLPVAALLAALALRQGAATEPHAAAEAAALGFRGIGLGLLLAAAAAGWSLHRGAFRPRERDEWRRAAAAIALLCVAVLAFDRLAARRVTADTLAKHGLVWLELRSAAVGWQLLDAASRLDPREPVHWMERARVDLQRAARDPSPGAFVADAVRSLERAIELAPREADAWANLGLARLLTRDDRPDALEAAGRAYDRALELRPDWPQVLEQVAGVAALQGDARAAARWRSRARALAPEAQ